MTTREKWVAALRAGDEAAWKRLLTEHGKLILVAARRVRLPPEDVEDVFQSTCFAAYRAMGTLRDPQKLESWLYGIAYRFALDLATRRKPTQSLDDERIAMDVERALPKDPPVERVMEAAEEAEQLADALAQADSRCRRLLTYLYLTDPRPSYDEISEEEGMPVGSIGPTRARCLEKLRNLLRSVSKSPSSSSTGSNRPDEAGGPDVPEEVG